jgi:hypothetical protein
MSTGRVGVVEEAAVEDTAVGVPTGGAPASTTVLDALEAAVVGLDTLLADAPDAPPPTCWMISPGPPPWPGGCGPG